MNRVVLGLAAGGIALAAGCASQPPEDPRVAEVAAQVKFTKTEFDEQLRVQGPRVESPGQWFLIRSWLGDSSYYLTHQLYLKIDYVGEEREYRSANRPGGKLENLTIIDRKSDCEFTINPALDCAREEHVGLYIGKRELRNAAQHGGLRLRINAKRGEPIILHIPEYYLKGYLRALEPRLKARH